MYEKKEYILGKLRFRVIKGDITRVKADAIVNPANSLMVMGGGVAGALKRVGGTVIEKEALRYAPVPVGKAIATTAGKLDAKHVIHAPTMERPAMRIGIDNVVKAVHAALVKAEELGVDCIAFPGMGTGVGGVDPKEAARAMIDEIIGFWGEKKGKCIILVAFDEELYRAFMEALENKK